MKVLLRPSISREEVSARLKSIAGVELVVVENAAELDGAMADAEVLVFAAALYDHRLAESLRKHGRRVRLIQLLTAGYEAPQTLGVPPGVVVATAGDSYSPGVAEQAMALLLGLAKCLPQALANQARHGWDRGFSANMTGLDGKTLAVIGLGSIGREMARRARAFGMKIIGVSRSAKPDPLADEVQPVGSLKSVLARADAVLLSLPYTKETKRMIGAAELAACRPGAVLINISRGAIVDTAALAAALKDGTIGGAGLDVTEPEPLPPEDPLWDCPNLIISPHVAGASGARGRLRLANFVGENIERFIAGQPLQHVVAF